MILLNNDKLKIHDKPFIVIDDEDNSSTENQETLLDEEPVITIETDDEPEKENVATPSETKVLTNFRRVRDYDETIDAGQRKKSRFIAKRWVRYTLAIVGAALLSLVCYEALRIYRYYYNIGVSVSVTPQENIDKLESATPAPGGESAIVLTSDSILGVALNMFELRNVQAEMTLEEPDTTDQRLLMYTRTSDYTVKGKHIGSLVIDGERLQRNVSRLGYCAIVGDKMVIGISRSDKVRRYVEENKGSYFRQFMLLSNGELPKRFYLHGKVGRKALARMDDDRLYIVETRYAETLWDFADALREYGFVDAIYLTGGNHSLSGFFRNSDGSIIYSDEAAEYRNSKHHGVAPWLVLRKR